MKKVLALALAAISLLSSSGCAAPSGSGGDIASGAEPVSQHSGVGPSSQSIGGGTSSSLPVQSTPSGQGESHAMIDQVLLAWEGETELLAEDVSLGEAVAFRSTAGWAQPEPDSPNGGKAPRFILVGEGKEIPVTTARIVAPTPSFTLEYTGVISAGGIGFFL